MNEHARTYAGHAFQIPMRFAQLFGSLSVHIRSLANSHQYDPNQSAKVVNWIQLECNNRSWNYIAHQHHLSTIT
jgi:hypothetical protein